LSAHALLKPVRYRFALAATLVVLAAPSAAAQGRPDLKSLSIVVGSTPGGGYDTYARLLARHMARHLPSQPGIIVQNMPGASSLKAVQYLDAMPPRTAA
jgi:tripartite-type tricarboxylate transporter receptor subunit TctC